MTTTATATTELSAETRNWTVASHLSAFVGLFGVPSFLGPLFIWLLKKDDPQVVNAAIEATNFNLSFLLYAFVAGLSIVALVGIILLPAVLITWFALTIVAAVRASDGEDYRYPFTIAFIR